VGTMASELWGDADGFKAKSHKFGKGTILNGMDMKEAFDVINCIPDCKLPDDNTIHYGHRTLGYGEIYFVSNQTKETKIVSPVFRIKGMQPELWEATTGCMRNLNVYEQNENTTTVPLKLEPFESVFVVFRKQSERAQDGNIQTNYPEPVLMNELNGPWTVRFDTAQRGPEQAVIFETLKDWTTFSNEKIKYYSGTAEYSCKFKLNKRSTGEHLIIDLGSLTAMAKVTLNGTYAGGLWTSPYRLDITSLANDGENELKVDVVNTWVNRLIGDSKLPESQRPTWCPVNPYKPDSQLQPSGLFGPVKINSFKYE